MVVVGVGESASPYGEASSWKGEIKDGSRNGDWPEAFISSLKGERVLVRGGASRKDCGWT